MNVPASNRIFVHITGAIFALLGTACGSGGTEEDVEHDLGTVEESLVGNCTATLTASPSLRQTALAGGVTFTGSAICVGGATPEYRFTANTPATNTKLVACNWQSGSVCNWNTSALTQEGIYTLAVEVRRQGLTAVDVKKTLRYGIGRSCTGVGVAVAPSPPNLDDLVTFTATPTCDPGSVPEYRFDIKPPGATVFSLGSWQSSPIGTWDSTGASAGTASVRVTLRQQGYKLNDATKTLPFVLGAENCKATALTVGTTGPNLALTGKSSCTGGGIAEYRFLQVGPTGASTLLEDWSADRFGTWPTAGLSGSYYARVEVRAQGTPQVPSFRQMKKTFGDACTSVTLAPVAGPVVLGNAASLDASAPCPNPEFLYQVKPSTGTAWTTVCTYSTSATCNWVAPLVTAPGTYNARVQVRAVGTTLVAYEALSSPQNFDVVTAAPDGDGDGFSVAAGDCDDGNANVHPGATESCNGIDDDCDGQIDEGLDADGDGVTTCGGDCNDGNGTVHPGATETCNAVDDDCDGQVDEGFDGDGDGVTSCEGDCDDGDATVFPGATETCNGEDDDCDGQIDDGFDVDGDGVSACDGDCNDGNAAVHPGATEACNGIDDDCDGAADNAWTLQANLAAGNRPELEGDTLVVGGFVTATVWARTGANWTQQPSIVPSTGTASNLTVALDGNTLLIGAPNANLSGSQSGRAYIYQRSGTVWTLQAQLIPSDPGSGRKFGASVALDGGTAVIANGGGTNAVYVFTGAGTSWSQQARLTDVNGNPNFGSRTGVEVSQALALRGGTLAVGSALDDPAGALNAGSVSIFTGSGAAWTFETKLATGVTGDGFGDRVSLEGNTLVVTAVTTSNEISATYAYTGAGASWTQASFADAAPGVDLSGDFVVFGNGSLDVSGFDSAGSAWLYRRNGTTWTRDATLVPESTPSAPYPYTGFGFGGGVSIDGTTVAISSLGQAGGYVDVFTRTCPVVP